MSRPDAPKPDEPRRPGSERRTIPAALLLLALAFAVAGQMFLSYSPGPTWVGIAAFAGSFLLLLLLMRSLNRGSEATGESRLLRALGEAFPSVIGPSLLALGVLGSVTAAAFSQARSPTLRGWPSFAFWLTGVLALLAFVVREAVRSRRENGALGFSRVEIAGIVGVTACAFVLRFVRLEDVPYPISGDEASVGMEGLRILAGTSTDMFRTGWSLQPHLSFLGPALSMASFGEPLVGLRLFPVLAGTFTVPALYLMVRSMFSRQVAFYAAVLLAAMPFHVHFSRIAANIVDATLIICGAIGLLFAMSSERVAHCFVAAGLACGLSLYSFAGARLVFVVAALYLAYLLGTSREFRRSWLGILLFGVAVAVAVLPTAVHFLQDTNVAFGRFRQVGVIQTGWLGDESTRTGQPAVLLLGRHLIRSFSIFVSEPATAGFYNSPKPLLDPLWSVALLLGMMFSWTRLADRRNALLNIWFWSTIVFGGALIIPPADAERFLLAAPAVAAFAAWGIWGAWSLVERVSGKRVAAVGALVSVAVLAASGVSFYFREYTPRYYFADPNGEVGTELGRYLARQPRVRHVYFTGLPRMWYRSFASTDFLSGGVPGEDFAAGTLPDIQGKKRPVLFVVLPHLRSELATVSRAYPGGRSFVVMRRPEPREPLFFLYRLD